MRDEAITAEADVARMVAKALEEDKVLPLEVPAGRALLAAWRRLQRSGELERRLRGYMRRLRESTAHGDALFVDANTRVCALAACGAPELRARAFSLCAACKAVAYCCKEHQVTDWPAHKAACKAARRGGTGAAAAPQPQR